MNKKAYLTRLRDAGVPDPAGDLRRLADYAFGPSLTQERGEAPQEDWDIFDAAIEARVARRPVSRIIGQRAFWRHDFQVTDAVLDPRPETETLVACALEVPFERVLDLGTGSGCVLLSLLGERPQARGVGTDLSQAALEVATSNAKALNVNGKASFLLSDWYKGLGDQQVDLIVSNPPYISAAEMPGLDPEVRDWDPAQALTDGADGLTAYRAITQGAAAHLAPGGWLMVEIGHEQGADVLQLFQNAKFQNLTLSPDLGGKDRVVLGQRPPLR